MARPSDEASSEDQARLSRAQWRRSEAIVYRLLLAIAVVAVVVLGLMIALRSH